MTTESAIAGEKMRPEIYVAIVGAVGADLKPVSDAVGAALKAVKYRPFVVRLSAILKEVQVLNDVLAPLSTSSTEEIRIRTLMDAGNRFRTLARRGDAVALLGIDRIRQLRIEHNSTATKPFSGAAYILVSLKHPAEVETLRSLYGDSCLVLSVYASKHQRQKELARNIAKSKKDRKQERYFDDAKKLVDADEQEVGDGYGQNVRTTFPEADYFIDLNGDVRLQADRLIRLLFGDPFCTPTPLESSMFHARAAALRSADLSRQVGAVIADENGRIVASGCNEVPRAQGGNCWASSADSAEDYRDFKLGYDANARLKHEIIEEIFDRLLDAGWLNEKISKQNARSLVNSVLAKNNKPTFTDLRIAGIIEFGRIIHAEMAAITEAARYGISIAGKTLVCTTFPCHMCARHVMASGISKVVYIEPYPKSMTKELYDRSVNIEGEEADQSAVVFLPFIGVAPRRFLDFFSLRDSNLRKRKDGYAQRWQPDDAIEPRISLTFNQYLDRENVLMAEVLEPVLNGNNVLPPT